jgi:hypothetical protein
MIAPRSSRRPPGTRTRRPARGQRPAVAAVDARPPRGAQAEAGDRREHDPEHDEPRREQRDLVASRTVSAYRKYAIEPMSAITSNTPVGVIRNGPTCGPDSGGGEARRAWAP